MSEIIRAACPACGKVHAAPSDLSGKSAKCRQCGATIIFPVLPNSVYDRPFQLDVDSSSIPIRERSGDHSAAPMKIWQVAFAIAVVGLLSFGPLLHIRDRWSSQSDAARMREINRRIMALKNQYESGKDDWSSSQALAEMKVQKDKMKLFNDEQWDRFRRLKSNHQSSYYRSPEGESNLAEQTALQFEYRDALWRHPDWQLASEAFPITSIP